MKLFEDDFVRLGEENYHAPEWPPPKFVRFNGKIWRRMTFSGITDEQREGMTHVVRGAQYEWAEAIMDVVTVDLKPLNAVSLADIIEKDKNK